MGRTQGLYIIPGRTDTRWSSLRISDQNLGFKYKTNPEESSSRCCGRNSNSCVISGLPSVPGLWIRIRWFWCRCFSSGFGSGLLFAVSHVVLLAPVSVPVFLVQVSNPKILVPVLYPVFLILVTDSMFWFQFCL